MKDEILMGTVEAAFAACFNPLSRAKCGTVFWRTAGSIIEKCLSTTGLPHEKPGD
jgi:hypothetical protein